LTIPTLSIFAPVSSSWSPDAVAVCGLKGELPIDEGVDKQARRSHESKSDGRKKAGAPKKRRYTSPKVPYPQNPCTSKSTVVLLGFLKIEESRAAFIGHMSLAGRNSEGIEP
jgi:hypothetical protein